MAQTVDERIVAAKFDASDFEKGVDKTIKKLDELKKSLNLKEATKGVKELAEKTEASTESMSKSLDKLTERFTNFAGMIKQKILSGLADEVAGVFLKMEQSVKSFITGISTEQVSAGLSKYEQMLTSVRIMMSAGFSEDAAYEQLDRLQTYTDETSYSLSQMSDAMSKMVAAGVSLEDAEKSVEGIANACANAGINAERASGAFYNLSQAYSSGVLEYRDYRSLELLNMTTKEFKEQMLEAAVAAGTLKKESEGVYKTINKNDKKVKAGKKVTIDNLSDTLKYDFMNKEAMNKLFGSTYWMEVIDKDEIAKLRKELGEEEFEKRFGKIATTAYNAAREARSFTDAINAIKDAVSSGWSRTFEHLFGRLEEAKEFFTGLVEVENPLANAIYKISEYRNTILELWNDDATGKGAGGKMLRDSIMNISDALGTLFKTIQQILPGFDELDEEGEKPGLTSFADRLLLITAKLRDFTIRIKQAAHSFNEFMNSRIVEDGPTRIEMIRKTLSNLASVFSIVGKVVGIAFTSIGKVLNVLSPVFDGFLTFMSKVTEPLVELKDNSSVFDDITHSVDNMMMILKPIADVLGQVVGFLGEVGAFIAQMAIGTLTSNITFFADALGLVLEILTGNSAQMKDGQSVLDKIRSDFEGIKSACQEGLDAIKEFFSALFADIRQLLGLTEETEGEGNQNGGIFANLTKFFDTNEFVQNAKAWINQAFIDIGDFIKSIPDRIYKFGVNLYETLYGLFFKEETKYNGSMLETKTILTPLGEWISKVADDIKNFVISIPQRIVDGISKIGSWIDDVFEYIFGGRKDGSKHYEKDENGQWQEVETVWASRFDEFIYTTSASIRAWFADLPNKIQKALASVGKFATKVYNAIDEFLFGKKVEKTQTMADKNGNVYTQKVTVRYKKGFSKWLDGIIKEITKFIKNIPEYIKAGIKGAGDIISAVVGAIFGKPEGETADKKDVEDAISKPFLGIDISNVLNTIKEIGLEIFNQIARIFTGTDDLEENQEWFANIIANGIEWIRDKAEIALNWVLDFLSDIPGNIAKLFNGESKDNPEQGPIGKALVGLGESIGKFITEDLPAAALNFINGAVDFFDVVWNKLYEAIIGGTEENGDKKSEQIEKKLMPDAMKGDPRFHVESAWEKFVKKLAKTISHIWEKLPVWVAEGINLAVTGLGELIGSVGDWLKGIGSYKDAEDAVEESSEGTAKAIEEGNKEGIKKGITKTGKKLPDEPELIKAIKNIGESIGNLFQTIIPEFIEDAWSAIWAVGSDIWEGISAVFTGEDATSEIGKFVQSLGQKFYDFITVEIPGFFQRAFQAIGRIFSNEDPFAMPKNVPDSAKGMVQQLLNTEENISEGLKGDTIWDAIAQFGKDIWKGITSVFTGEEPENDRQATVSGIVEKVKGFFVSAWEKLKEVGSGIWDGLSSLFTGKEAETEIGKAVKGFGETVYKFITEEIPAWFKKAFDFISKMFSSESAFDLPDSVPEAEKATVKAVLNTEQNISKNLKKSGVGTFLDDFKNSLIEAFHNIGPTILEGLASALSFLGDIVMIVVNALTGKKDIADQVEETFKKENPKLKSALKSIGESLKKLFMDIIPQALGSAMGTLIANASGFFSKFFGAMTEAKETAEKKAEKENPEAGKDPEKQIEGAKSALTTVFDIVNKFVSGLAAAVGLDIAKYIVIIIGVTMLFGALRDMFSMVDEMEAITDTIKWVGLTIAFSAIAGLISYLSSIPADEYDRKIQDIKDILGKLVEALTTVGTIVGLFTLKEAIDTVGDFAGDAKKTKDKLSAGEKAFGILEGGLKGFFTTLGLSFGADLGANMLSDASQKIISTISDGLTELGAGVQGMLEFINPFINDLVDLNDDVDVAVNTISKLGDLFAQLYNAFSNIYEEVGGDNVYYRAYENGNEASGPIKKIKMSATEFMNDLGKRVDLAIKVADFLKSLAAAIDSVSGVENISEKFKEISDVIGSEDFSNFLLNLLNKIAEAWDSSKLKPNEGFTATDSYRVLQALQMLASSLSLLADGMSGFDQSSVTAFNEMLDVLEKFSEAISEAEVRSSWFQTLFTGGNRLSWFGSEVKIFAGHMIGFYQKLKEVEGFKDSEVKETQDKVNSVIQIAEGFAVAASRVSNSTSANLVSLGENLANSTEYFVEFMRGMRDGLNGVSDGAIPITTEDLDKITATTEAIGNLSSMLWVFGNNSIATLTQSVYDDMTDDNAIKLGASVRGFMNKMFDTLTSPEYREEIVDVGKRIAEPLAAGIQEALNTDPELRITPVLNMDGMREQLRQFFGVDQTGELDLSNVVKATIGANSQTDESIINAETLYAKIDKIDEVTKAITELKDNQATISDVVTAFTGVQIMTDTNALVGAITDKMDASLGEKIWYIDRNVTPVSG